jgi:hypothetical protein
VTGLIILLLAGCERERGAAGGRLADMEIGGSERMELANDIVNSRSLIGKQRGEVVAQLGAPDWQDGNEVLGYGLTNDDIDDRYLGVWLENGKVVSCSIASD